ncbi:LPS assembly lipoprotein LptE [Paracoccaceae bacterium GXU_MW_L88]
MSWSRRHILLALAALPGCGFTPVYAPGSAASALDGQIAIALIPGGLGFALRERLQERLGRVETAPLLLEIDLDLDSEGRVITEDNRITRYTLTGEAPWRIVAGNQVVMEGRALSVTAWSATAAPFATRQAEEDAYRRLAISLAEKISLEIAARAGEIPPEALSAAPQGL